MDATAAAGPQSLPGYAIAQVFRVLRHETDRALRDLGLTTPQWGTLSCLAGNDGLTGADMARIHHVTPQTMHTILQNLEAAGLVVREPHPQHGTLLRVSLTEAGRERLDEANRRAQDVHERMLSRLDQRERTMLRDLLYRCMASLEADDSIAAEMP